jgi:serralysin
MQSFKLKGHISTEGHSAVCCCPGCMGLDSGDSAQTLDSGFSITPSILVKPMYFLPQIITQLTTSWGGMAEGTTRTWAGSTISYSIAGSLGLAPDDFGGPEAEGYNAAMMTAVKHDMAVQAFELWDDLVAVSLTETSAIAGGIITMAYSKTTHDDGTYAHAEVTGIGTHKTITAERIWLSSSWNTLNSDIDIQYGKYGFATYVHEIGHTLGLSHPGTYDASGGGPITYAADAEYAQDTRQNTVMSYFGGWTDSSGNGDVANDGIWSFISDGDHAMINGVTTDLYPSTPMVDDIAAIQAKYGADMTTRLGDTTYGFNCTAGRDVFDFNLDTRPIFTIWDAGGDHDTLDASGFSQNQVIDLAPGSYSSIGVFLGNIGIAYSCVIENAVGGMGDDVIYGNAANNVLQGGGGNDKLYGYDGNDTLDGGPGADQMYGGAGDDTYKVDDPGDQVIDQLDGGIDLVLIYATVYTLPVHVENATVALSARATGAPGAAVYGNAQANVLTGSGLIDSLFGGAGNDTLNGGAGDDTLDGGLGRDVLTGGLGNDTFVFKRGEANGDVITDFNGNGRLLGDQIRFVDYGPGAFLTAPDPSHAVVHTADGAVADIIEIRSAIPIHPSDYFFV